MFSRLNVHLEKHDCLGTHLKHGGGCPSPFESYRFAGSLSTYLSLSACCPPLKSFLVSVFAHVPLLRAVIVKGVCSGVRVAFARLQACGGRKQESSDKFVRFELRRLVGTPRLSLFDRERPLRRPLYLGFCRCRKEHHFTCTQAWLPVRYDGCVGLILKEVSSRCIMLTNV